MPIFHFRLPRRAGPVPLVTPRFCLLVALLTFALMVGIGALPGKASALSALVYDKTLHLIAYAFLSALLYAGLPGHPLPRALGVLVAAALLGAVDEVLQGWLPYRHANWADWKVDMAASALIVSVASPLHMIRLAVGNDMSPRRETTQGADLPDRPASTN